MYNELLVVPKPNFDIFTDINIKNASIPRLNISAILLYCADLIKSPCKRPITFYFEYSDEKYCPMHGANTEYDSCPVCDREILITAHLKVEERREKK